MNIYKFIKSLSSAEISLISRCFEPKKSRKGSFSDEAFFNAVVSSDEKEITDELIFRILGEPESDIAFSKLKSRVFLKILDRISSDDFISNDDFLDAGERAMMRTKKKLLQLKILKRKKKKSSKEVEMHLLNEIIEEAKEYEQFDHLVEALTIKKYQAVTRAGYKEFLKIQSEIDFYSECSKSLRTANDTYYVLIGNQRLISHFSNEEMERFIAEKIRAFETDPYTTVSSGIQYFYKILKLYVYQKNKQYTEAVDCCLDLLSLLRRSKAVKRTERFGFVYDNLSECWLLQRNFVEAVETSRAAQKFFLEDSISYVISKEQEFLACFYNKNYSDCREIIETLLSHDKRDTGQIRFDKYTYFSGCLDLMEGRYKEALRVSSLALHIMKDKPRWELGVRYLKIMSLLELGQFGEAEDAIESLRKQLKRNRDEGLASDAERDETIYKAFREYCICGFGSHASQRLVYLLKKLGAKDTELSWKFYTHEIIPVQKWIRKRITSFDAVKEGKVEKLKVQHASAKRK